MRTNVLFFGVLAIAQVFVACGQEDDGSMQGGTFLDASQPSIAADAGGVVADTGVGNPSNPPRPDAGIALIPGDAGANSGLRNDAGGMVSRDAGADAGAPIDSGGPGSNPDGAAAGYSPCPSAGEPCKILPLGDSITVGLQSTSGGGYRLELFKKAHAANQNITFVGSQRGGPAKLPDGTAFPPNHEGYSGWTVSQIAGKVPDPALKEKPHITLLMAGTNDVTFGDPTTAPMQLGMLIDELVSSDPNMLVVVAQITPRGAFGGGAVAPNPATESYNRALPAEVQRRMSAGKHVLLVDMYTGFPMNGLSDGVHPNDQGYAFMADVWYKAISPYLH